MGERDFDNPSLGGDLWPMGFDMDLALDSPLHRKNLSGMASSNLSTNTPIANNPVNSNYGDMNQMLFQRFDDLNEGDISQITDLTNSLPKGDTESAQSLLAKFACHELESDSAQKSIEDSFFGSVSDASAQESNLLSSKHPIDSTDVYGRLTCYEGKLVLQLRHFNLNTNYPVSVSECWLCREKLMPGSQLHSHKHVLQGVFQVNDEFVQMDIDHYIIPEQALNGPDSKDISDIMNTSNLISTAASDEFEQNIDGAQSLNFGEDIASSVASQGSHSVSTDWPSHPLSVEGANEILREHKSNEDMQYSESLNSLAISQNPCLATFANGNLTGLTVPTPNGLISTVQNSIPHGSSNAVRYIPSNNSRQTTSVVNLSSNKQNLTSSAVNTNSRQNTSIICVPTKPFSKNMNAGQHGSSINNTEMLRTSCSSNSNTLVSSVSSNGTNWRTTTSSSGNTVSSYTSHRNVPDNFATGRDHQNDIMTSLEIKPFINSRDGIPFQQTSIMNPQILPLTTESESPNSTSLCASFQSNLHCQADIYNNFPSSTKSDVMAASSSDSFKQSDIQFNGKGTLQPSSSNSNPLSKQNVSHHTSPSVNENKEQNTGYQSFFGNQFEYPYNNSSFNSTLVKTKSEYTTDQLNKTSIGNEKTEIGAKKRKSKTQKKLSVIKLKEDCNSERAGANISTDKNITTHCESSLTTQIDHKFSDNSLSQRVSDVDTGSSNNCINTGNKTFNKSTAVTSAALRNSYKIRDILLKGKLLCRLCNMEFTKCWVSYKEHMQDHGVPDSELFVCVVCPKKFSTSRHYLQHLKIHSLTRYHCKLCTTTFSRTEKLRRHIQAFHEKKAPHKCNICNKSFLRKEYLMKHKLLHDERKLKCNLCDTSCSNKYNLEVHKRKHSESKPYKCELCDRGFIRRDFLDVHMEKDHKKKKLRCDLCEKSFSRSDALLRHKRTHRPVSFACRICPKKYTRMDLLKKHEKSHNEPAQNKCPECPAFFKRKEVLKKHLDSHKTKQQCNICFKFLPTNLQLQNHLQWHEKQVNAKIKNDLLSFKCQSCTKSYATKEKLQKHVQRIHSVIDPTQKPIKIISERGEKKFFCNLCSKGFTRSCNLRAHIKAHNKCADDEKILAELPSVLSVSKSMPKPKRKNATSTLTEIGGSPTSVLETSSIQTLPTSGFKVKEHSTVNSFQKPLDDGFPSIPYSGHGPYATGFHSAPSPTELPTPTFGGSACPSSSSPINLSTEVITAAAYLLAYPSYSGPY